MLGYLENGNGYWGMGDMTNLPEDYEISGNQNTFLKKLH